MNNSLIECKYGNHIVDISNFTPSGLNGPYKICRECVRNRRNNYRQKYRDKYNESKREYNRQWMANKRTQDKLNKNNNSISVN